MLGFDEPWQAAAAAGAAFLAGALNAGAGGGTNITFPVLVWLGVPPVEANATNAVAIWPGSASAAYAYREEIAAARPAWRALVVPSIAGGVLGAILLVALPSRVFAAIAPWLVIGSTLVLALEPALARRLPADGERAAGPGARGAAAQLLLSTYGGYFGAGMGFLNLAILALLGLRDLQRANALKNLFAFAIKGAAVLYFLAAGRALWRPALLMGAAALAGGYAGAAAARRVGGGPLRWGVVAIGLALGALMAAGAI